MKEFTETIDIGDTRPQSVPLSKGEVSAILASGRGEESPPVDWTLYKHITGKANYAMTGTQPDIAFALSFLGKYQAEPKEIHLNAAKKLISYLKENPNYHIYYPRGEGRAIFHGYADADWGGSEGRKSTGAFIFFLGDSPISWQSKI